MTVGINYKKRDNEKHYIYTLHPADTHSIIL
jgi:hypothetical protein